MIEMLDTRPYKNWPINGIILLAQTEIEGKVHYLVQAKAEGGATQQKNNVFLTTSIQASFSNAELNPGKIPLWKELAPDLNQATPLKTSLAPSIEDPGIFFGKQNLLVMRHLSAQEASSLRLPETHVWADREAIRHFQLKGETTQFIAQVLGTFE